MIYLGVYGGLNLIPAAKRSVLVDAVTDAVFDRFEGVRPGQ